MKTFKAFIPRKPPPMNHSDTLLKTRQVARALGVSVSTIKRWVDSGVLPASRTVGKHRLIPLREVLRFAREQGLTVATWEALGGSKDATGSREWRLACVRPWSRPCAGPVP